MSDTTNIHSNVMLVELRVSQWTARKMDKGVSSKVAAESHVDESVGNYYKSLLDPEVLRQIKKHINETRSQYYTMTLPWADEGPRVLSAAMYFEFMEKMSNAREEFERLVNGFLNDYPFHREEAKRFLGDLFKEGDYPDPLALASKFGFSLNVRPLPHSNDFRCDIGTEEVAKIRADIEAQTRDTLQATVKAAFDRILVVATRYADRLEGDGVFRDSMVEGARDLVEIMPKLNITNDPELDRLTEVVREKLAAHQPEALRTNMSVRKEAADTAKQVVSDIESIFGGSN